jgi:hypothetical protein
VWGLDIGIRGGSERVGLVARRTRNGERTGPRERGCWKGVCVVGSGRSLARWWRVFGRALGQQRRLKGSWEGSCSCRERGGSWRGCS